MISIIMHNSSRKEVMKRKVQKNYTKREGEGEREREREKEREIYIERVNIHSRLGTLFSLQS